MTDEAKDFLQAFDEAQARLRDMPDATLTDLPEAVLAEMEKRGLLTPQRVRADKKLADSRRPGIIGVQPKR